MAYKQKSGSPFRRNFGIGKSPLEAKPKTHEEVYGPGDPNEPKEKAPLEMASPVKMLDVIVDGVNYGTGPEAMAIGKAAESKREAGVRNEYISTGGGENYKLGNYTAEEEASVKDMEAKNAQALKDSEMEIEYTDQDAIDRINNSWGLQSQQLTPGAGATPRMIKKAKLLKGVREGKSYKPNTFGGAGELGID